MVKMPFFCLNIIDDYNNGMNDVDLADQVRNVYHWDLFMPKRKWWWSMMVWYLQMIQADSFVLYTTYMVMYDQETMSHFEFNKHICLAWIDLESYWSKKKQGYQARASKFVSICTTRSITTSHFVIKRAPKLSERSLFPLNGNLRARLSEYEPHWPVPNTKKNASCQLHR